MMFLLPSPKNFSTLEGITHFLHHNYKVLMYHKIAFHKGYINYYPEFGFQLAVICNAPSRKMDFTVPLPDFKKNRTKIIGEDVFFLFIRQSDHS